MGAELDALNEKNADRIRQYVLEKYILPARGRGDPFVSVKVREVHDALLLDRNWANVCQAISGKKFQSLAGVKEPQQKGADASSTTAFIFDLRAEGLTIDEVEGELARRFGAPVKDVQKILAFQLPDGREIALDRERPPAQLWLETAHGLPEVYQSRQYAQNENRHHGLPQRLNHTSALGPVAMVRVSSMGELDDLLSWYEKPAILNREKLEEYRRIFLKRYPDFEPQGFAADEGGYFDEERAYKNKLIDRAQDALAKFANEDDAVLGARLLDIVTGQAGVPSGLLGWRTDARIKALRASHPGLLEREAGRLARAGSIDLAISEFVESTWPILSEGLTSRPYSESRNIPTMLAALVQPTRAYGINSDPVSRLARALTGEQIVGYNPLTRDEYKNILMLVESIRDAMTIEWGWAPRDLWDVQGFVWAVNRSDPVQQSDKAEESLPMNPMTPPTNLILYGPPGTGKTYATAREAVLLCNGAVPEGREELMSEYGRLSAAGRIEFVTFHQSYSYEEFVEGLRPVQPDEGTAGFRLSPEPGTFRRIARRAETSTGPGTNDFKIGERQVFKMSIGEAANPDDAYLFDEALKEGYTLLGFDDIDWSDPRFVSRDAIIQACRNHDLEHGKSLPLVSAMSGRVQCPFIFRNWMRKGDIIIVSKGNGLFRAIGEITGDYEYAAREEGIYSHRRAVRWLWHDRAGVSVEEIYPRGFSMRSVYLMTHADLNLPALERYIASQQPAESGAPEPFVLVIDEINRANISKVFGELITLLEPDKRLGEKNELKVRLPYSREMFGVPANLHIVGTMNTADRSIALLDTALRRRFEFRELMPSPALLSEASAATGVNLTNLLGMINERIEFLFDREHQIGHAYFINCKSKSDVDSVMRHRVIPLLAEYFYEDWTKVAAVLGDANGEGKFLERVLLKEPIGVDAGDGSDPRFSWRIKTPFNGSCYDQFQ